MKITHTLLLSLLALSVTGCTWVSRDYYFGSSDKNNGWSKKFQPGKNSDKNGTHPDAVIFSYTSSFMDFDFNISYQNPTFWSPLIIPVIPAPGTFTGLYVDMTIDAKDVVSFDVNAWVITDLSTGKKYRPGWIGSTMPEILQKGEKKRLIIGFPVKAKRVDTLEISFGCFSGSDRKIIPSPLLLNKVKGGLRFNQFTL